MNKEDIKKAIKCCFDYNCAECPNAKIKGYGCKDKLHADALNLITEQEKDIKQLKTECALLDDELRIARQETIDVLNKLKAENEELTKVVSSKVYDLIDNAKEIADAREAWEQQAKIEVLNKLKEKCHNYYPSIDHYCCSVKAVTLSDINEMIAEVQNAEDKS